MVTRVSLENILVPLTSRARWREGVVFLALDSHGMEVCYWQGWVIWSKCFYHRHRGQIKQGATSPEAHRRFCWNPLMSSTEGQAETMGNWGVGGRNVISSSILFTSLSSGLGTWSSSEAQTKKLRNHNSFRGWLWISGFLFSHVRRFTLFNRKTQ